METLDQALKAQVVWTDSPGRLRRQAVKVLSGAPQSIWLFDTPGEVQAMETALTDETQS